MKPAVQSQYTSAVRAAVAAAVGADAATMHDHDGFESFVHEADVEGEIRIVKATWGGRRTANEMGAEVDFVRYLSEQGAPVCRPLPLRDGAWQRAVPSEDGVFHVTSWAKAPGQSLAKEAFSAEAFYAWGALVGRLHRLSMTYPGPPAPLARPSWQTELGSLADLVSGEPDMHAHFQSLIGELEALPRARGSFGAMHTDMHRYNIHWHDGQMLVFDFEDMIDFWFVADLAIVLFYAVMSPLEGLDRQSLYDELQAPLWEGYASEHTLPPGAREALPLFMSLREHTLRAVVLRSIPEAERAPGWLTFLEESTQRIRKGAPALGLRL